MFYSTRTGRIRYTWGMSNMLAQIQNLIIDMDGVLWRGETPMPGLADLFTKLRQRQMGFVLATNNATKTAVMYSEKLARFGVDVPPAHIITSAEATAGYLREAYDGQTAVTVYVVGEKGLHDAIVAQGFSILSAAQVHDGARPDLVVVGFTREATYKELAMGALAVHKGARFIGTNPDPAFPSELGPLPGAGALIGFIQIATGVEPTLIGKPGPIMFQQAMKRLGSTPQNTAMVGDRLTTDILGAKNARLHAILLLSGISTRAEVAQSGIYPDFIFADIVELTAVL